VGQRGHCGFASPMLGQTDARAALRELLRFVDRVSIDINFC
jgi:hypothetical protein